LEYTNLGVDNTPNYMYNMIKKLRGRWKTITKVIKVDNLVQTSINFKKGVLDDLDIVAEAVGTKKTRLVNEIVEYYLYSDQDVIIQNGNLKFKVSDILKSKKD